MSTIFEDCVQLAATRRSCSKYEHRDNFVPPVHEVVMRECPDCYREALEKQHAVLLQFTERVANATVFLYAMEIKDWARDALETIKEIRE